MRNALILAAISATMSLVPLVRATSQGRSSSSGAGTSASVGAEAIGRPAPTPTPIGGLKTVPIPPAGARGPRGTGVSVIRGVPLRGVIPLAVADAPPVGGGIVITQSSPDVPAGMVWTPTAERPRWVVDSSVAPVQAWRDLIVTDVVCNRAATCVERRQRVRARWVATCRCYAFADGLGRVWKTRE